MSATGAGFVWDERVTAHVYREDHPLKPIRLVGVHDTLEQLGAFRRPGAKVLPVREATRAELERVHAPEYVEAVMQASADPDLDYSEWGLSAWRDTPPFAGMHEVSILTTGGSLVAIPISPVPDLLIASSATPSAAAGDVWPTSIGFASVLPVVGPGHYTATLTFTVIGR